MTVESLASRLSVAVIGFFLTLAPTVTSLHAEESTRKTTVVSFGLFGDQGVFRREATGAAQVVANRFGGNRKLPSAARRPKRSSHPVSPRCSAAQGCETRS